MDPDDQAKLNELLASYGIEEVINAAAKLHRPTHPDFEFLTAAREASQDLVATTRLAERLSAVLNFEVNW